MNLRPQALLHSRLEAFAYKQRTTLWCEITHQPETHTRIPCLSASGLGQMCLQNTTNITLYTFTITTNFACMKPKPSLSHISVSSMCYFTALLRNVTCKTEEMSTSLATFQVENLSQLYFANTSKNVRSSVV